MFGEWGDDSGVGMGSLTVMATTIVVAIPGKHLQKYLSWLVLAQQSFAIPLGGWIRPWTVGALVLHPVPSDGVWLGPGTVVIVLGTSWTMWSPSPGHTFLWSGTGGTITGQFRCLVGATQSFNYVPESSLVHPHIFKWILVKGYYLELIMTDVLYVPFECVQQPPGLSPGQWAMRSVPRTFTLHLIELRTWHGVRGI